MAEQASLYSTKNINIEELKGLLAAGLKAELCAETYRQVGQTTVIQLAFDRYYFRSRSVASLVLLILKTNEDCQIDLISTGGGEGIFKIDLWGTHGSFLNKASSLLRSIGFQ